MPDPGFIRSSLCSIRGAGQAEFAGVVHGLSSAADCPLATDDLLTRLAHDVACTLIRASLIRASDYPDRPEGACLITNRGDERAEDGQ